MTLNLKHLRALAEAATPAPWNWDEGEPPDALLGGPANIPEWLQGKGERPEVWRERIITTDSGCYGPNAADRAFIAAANPSTVLELLDEVGRLRRERDNARANARILAHSYTHDSRPPQRAVEEALAYPARPEAK